MVLEPNQTVFPVQTRTAGGLRRPVANTKGGQHFDYSLMSLHSSLIIQNARTKIFDAALTVILLRQWRCPPKNFWLRRRLILRLYVTATKFCFDYQTHKTKNHWCIVETHVQVGATRVPLLFLPITTAYTIPLEGCYYTAHCLRNM